LLKRRVNVAQEKEVVAVGDSVGDGAPVRFKELQDQRI